MEIQVSPATREDFPAIWPIFKAVVEPGDTWPYLPDIPYEEAISLWFNMTMAIYLVKADDQLVGVYYLRPNQPGLGSHIANGGIMIDPKYRSQGIGKAMLAHMFQEAKRRGYQAMQFNLVVSTNTASLKMALSSGCEIIGTIPKAFQHQTLGLVDAHILYKFLE